jgi:four helix bundle protein
MMVKEWPQFAMNTIGKQLVRSADTIGANIAEGNGRWSYNDNKRFVKIAKGSLHETRHFLRRAFARKLITIEQKNIIQPIINELGPKLNAYLNSIGPKSKTVKHNDQLTTDN